MKLSASVLSAGNKKDAIDKLNKTNIDYIHLDVMDNKFVNNETFSIDEIVKCVSICNKRVDIHFMVEDPLYYLDKLIGISFDYFIFHIEVDGVDEIIRRLKDTNYKIGLAIKPNTDINKLDMYLDDIDLILVMSVEPGYGGQKFIESTYNRILEIRKIIGNRDILIEVDGGINDSNYKQIDADIIVVGSFITNSSDYQKQINLLK